MEESNEESQLIKETSGCHIKYFNNFLLQYVFSFVVVEFLAFRQPRKITAVFMECLLHTKIDPSYLI